MTAMQMALWGTIALYGLLALLLLNLNIFSLWRWWVKAGVMVVTAIVFVSAYGVLSGLIGWPSASQLPPRFSLLHTYIEEPDKQRDFAGNIYLWVQEVDDNQIPIAAPRAYVMPYVVETMKGVTQSQEMLDRGEKVLGESKTQVTETGEKNGVDNGGEASNDHEANRGQVNNSTGGQRTNNSAGSIFGFPGGQTVNFSPMPAVSLPRKADIPTG
jgi:hypothetical protein